MLAASGTFIAAATGKERFPVHEVLTDPLRDGSWAMDPGIFDDTFSDTFSSLGEMGDVTRFVESVDLDESLATDRPAGARTGPGGMASAEATVVLSGSLSGMRLVEAFSGYNNPLSILAPRLGMPITIALGFTGAAGDETLPQFTGKVRSCHVDADAGTVTLTCLDNAERFRTPVALPVVFADDHGSAPSAKRPGDNAQWLIDWIARKQGYNASPPIRSSCILSATMHGSVWPEVGTLVLAGGYATGGAVLRGPVEFQAHPNGLLGMASVPVGASRTYAAYLTAGLVTADAGSTLFVEFDQLDFISGSPTFRLGQTSLFNWSVTIIFDPAGGTITVTVRRGAVNGSVVLSTLGILTGDLGAYFGVQITFTSTGFVAQAKYNATTASATGVIADPGGAVPLSVCEVICPDGTTCTFSGLQITTEPYTAGMFSNGFTPTAILEPSLNELTSTPVVDTSDPWLIGQQIADAEQGILTFVDDVLHFFNQAHLSGGAAVATITTDPSVSFANLKQSASSDEAIDTVNNVISGSATPYTLDAASTVIWSLGEVMSVPAGGSITIPAEFPGPVYLLSSVTHRASQTVDGTGGDITNLNITWTAVTASSYIITASNPNAFAAYIVGNLSGGTPGEPTLNIVGRCTRPSEFPYLSVATDAASVALYGSQPLDLTDNPFRQSATSLAAFTAALLANLKDPHPEIGDLEIVGEPRLQLTDRVRVSDPDGLVLDDDFWLVSRKTTYSASAGLAQTVGLRQA